jgi:aspartate/methionine/tyrosine aminotransferase
MYSFLQSHISLNFSWPATSSVGGATTTGRLQVALDLVLNFLKGVLLPMPSWDPLFNHCLQFLAAILRHYRTTWGIDESKLEKAITERDCCISGSRVCSFDYH